MLPPERERLGLLVIIISALCHFALSTLDFPTPSPTESSDTRAEAVTCPGAEPMLTNSTMPLELAHCPGADTETAITRPLNPEVRRLEATQLLILCQVSVLDMIDYLTVSRSQRTDHQYSCSSTSCVAGSVLENVLYHVTSENEVEVL
jgi:hypothetical protein